MMLAATDVGLSWHEFLDNLAFKSFGLFLGRPDSDFRALKPRNETIRVGSFGIFGSRDKCWDKFTKDSKKTWGF